MRLKELTFITFDDYDETRTVSGIPAGALLVAAWWAIKRNESDDDSAAVVMKNISGSPTAAGQITDTGADGTGALTFSLSHTDTALLTPGQQYHGMMKGLLDNGKVGTFERQKIKVVQGIVRAVA